jgi:hypothetical protein
MLEDCKIAEDDLVTIMAELNAHRAHMVRARMTL